MRHAAGMLVTAMEEHDRSAWSRRCGRPMAVEEVYAVMRAKRRLFRRAQWSGAGWTGR
jgi:hypothetical protein